MMVAIDPNVCLAASLGDPASQALLEDIFDNRKDLIVVVDNRETSHAIRREYEALSPSLDADRQRWLAWLLDPAEQQVCELPAPLAQRDLSDLKDLQCDTPVEPELIALGAEVGRDVSVIVVGHNYVHPAFKSRGSHDKIVVRQLKTRYGSHLCVWPASEARRAIETWLHKRLPYPYNEWQLNDYLARHRYVESDVLEFKQPVAGQDAAWPEYLTPSIMDSAMESLCAFANTYGGDVIIGIYEDPATKKGHIHGFPLKYGSTGGIIRDKAEDELLQLLENKWLSRVTPLLNPSDLRYWFIDVHGGWKVLIMRVNKVQYELTYSGVAYYRHGTEDKARKRRR